ncbi:MAG: serpin family protein [Clostridia bacterium]|nr:serpin family protein [Clostridia bacterium]
MKRLFTTALSLALCAILLLSYTACAVTVKAEDLMEGYTRTAADAGLTADQKSAGQKACLDFAFALFTESLKDESTKNTPNRMISPLSAMMCLALIANGTDGNTKAQMEQTLGLPVGDLDRFLYDYWQNLYSADDCKVALANSVWFRDDADRLKVEPAFLQSVADWYQAQAYAAPFDASTVKDINRWCADHTDGMIDEIIDKINDDTVMYLVNALVFDAKWYKQYENADVMDDAFTNADGTTANVKMLHSQETYYLSGDGFEGFARPYKGCKYDFVGLLPAEGTDVMDFAASLTADVWAKMWTDGHTPPENGWFPGVEAGIPEFGFEFGMSLNDTLKAMGMTDMFDSEAADFRPMATSAAGNIYCSEVAQKTYIELDRNGTKAAAITWGVMNDECDEPISAKKVILDRPFVYAIVDTESGLPLFIGVVTELK